VNPLNVLLCLVSGVLAPSFETGIVHASDGAAFYSNAYPVVARLESGKLLTVFAVLPKETKDARIVRSLSDDGGKTWSEPRLVIDNPGLRDVDPNIVLNGKRILVFSTTVDPQSKKIDRSQVFLSQSDDDGGTWSIPREIKFPFRYFVGKRHNGIRLADGTLAMPFSWDLWAERGIPAQTEGEMYEASGILLSKDGVEWTPFGALEIWEKKVTPFSNNGLSEPALVELSNGELLMLMRTGTTFFWESRSRDGGMTWDAPSQSRLMAHNTPAALWRLDEKPDEIICIWDNSPRNRYPLSVAISSDGGHNWSKPRDVATSEGGQISYPGITQASDGTFVAVWQEQLRQGGYNVRWARFNRDWVLGRSD
jgi:sialidase-1